MTDLVTLDDIRAAADRIKGAALRTPLISYPGAPADRPLWVKAEALQPTSAFKVRGAYNAISAQLDRAREGGVVSHSSGNHARAVAWTAAQLGLRAVIVMPDTTPPNKIAAVRALGAETVIVPPRERDTKAFELASEHGYLPIPPYDDPYVIAGQGTIGLEIVEDMPDVSAVWVPVSGGGLSAGIATAVKALRPSAKVFGVEPELAGDAAQSKREGRRVVWEPEETYRTIADGLRTTGVGVLNWEHISRYVDDVVTVTEEQILAAVRTVILDTRVVTEPSGAVATAGFLAHSGGAGKHVAILSGGSINPELLAEVMRG